MKEINGKFRLRYEIDLISTTTNLHIIMVGSKEIIIWNWKVPFKEYQGGGEAHQVYWKVVSIVVLDRERHDMRRVIFILSQETTERKDVRKGKVKQVLSGDKDSVWVT